MTILITGGSKGIGRAIAERFAAQGDRVLISYGHDDDAARAAAAAVQRAGGSPELLRGDLSRPEGVEELIGQVRSRVDHLDQVVHGAVLAKPTPTLELDARTYERALWLNGAVLLPLVQGLRPLLSSGSTVIFLSSRGAQKVVPDYVAIGAPKALAEALIRYLAVALAPEGIRALTVVVSAVRTQAILDVLPDAEAYLAQAADRNPFGRNVDLTQVASLVHLLTRPDVPMLSGHTITLDGASHLLT